MTRFEDPAWTYHTILELPNGGILAQGGYYSVPIKGFDVVMYTAAEFEPPPDPGTNTYEMSGIARFPTTLNYWAPNLDTENLAHAKQMSKAAKVAAAVIYKHLKEGKRVLCTCAQGRNRSGLANGFALRKFGMTGDEAVRLIQEKRPTALTNELFCKMIRES